MNILEQIQNAEQQANDIKRSAQTEARELILACERKAQEAASQKINAMEEKAAAAQKEAVRFAEKKADLYLSGNAEKDNVLIEKAQGNLQEAVAYIIRLAEDMK